jgi:hypothetical protein
MKSTDLKPQKQIQERQICTVWSFAAQIRTKLWLAKAESPTPVAVRLNKCWARLGRICLFHKTALLSTTFCSLRASDGAAFELQEHRTSFPIV